MNTLHIPKIKPRELDVTKLTSVLKDMPTHSIGQINWDGFPATVCASFKIAHDGEHILLVFDVSETEILAQIEEDNGHVYRDSCVEFFVSFDNNVDYYNLEFSCIGKLLMGHRDLRPNAKYATPEILDSIKRHSTLGDTPFDRKTGNFSWQLSIIIPRTAFWGDEIETFDGVTARGNFYKCGDQLSQKHFLSWAPINTEKPSFHEKDFFGILEFEK